MLSRQRIHKPAVRSSYLRKSLPSAAWLGWGIFNSTWVTHLFLPWLSLEGPPPVPCWRLGLSVLCHATPRRALVVSGASWVLCPLDPSPQATTEPLWNIFLPRQFLRKLLSCLSHVHQEQYGTGISHWMVFFYLHWFSGISFLHAAEFPYLNIINGACMVFLLFSLLIV